MITTGRIYGIYRWKQGQCLSVFSATRCGGMAAERARVRTLRGVTTHRSLNLDAVCPSVSSFTFAHREASGSAMFKAILGSLSNPQDT